MEIADLTVVEEDLKPDLQDLKAVLENLRQQQEADDVLENLRQQQEADNVLKNLRLQQKTDHVLENLQKQEETDDDDMKNLVHKQETDDDDLENLRHQQETDDDDLKNLRKQQETDDDDLESLRKQQETDDDHDDDLENLWQNQEEDDDDLENLWQNQEEDDDDLENLQQEADDDDPENLQQQQEKDDHHNLDNHCTFLQETEFTTEDEEDQQSGLQELQASPTTVSQQEEDSNSPHSLLKHCSVLLDRAEVRSYYCADTLDYKFSTETHFGHWRSRGIRNWAVRYKRGSYCGSLRKRPTQHRCKCHQDGCSSNIASMSTGSKGGGKVRSRKLHATANPRESLPLHDSPLTELDSPKNKSSNYIRVIPDNKNFKCLTCGDMFSYATSLRQHERMHGNYKLFACDFCSKQFKYRKNIRPHIKKFHANKIKLQSQINTQGSPNKNVKSVPNKCLANSVIKSASSIPLSSKFECLAKNGVREAYQCPHCHKNIKHKRNLQPHIEFYHSSNKCVPQNSKKNTTIAEQKAQLNLSKNNKSQCRICGKVFPNPSLMKRHVPIHSNEYPHTCPICLRGFKHQSYVYKHMATTHPEEKKHKCFMRGCRKLFFTPAEVTAHVNFKHRRRLNKSLKEAVKASVASDPSDKVIKSVDDNKVNKPNTVFKSKVILPAVFKSQLNLPSVPEPEVSAVKIQSSLQKNIKYVGNVNDLIQSMSHDIGRLSSAFVNIDKFDKLPGKIKTNSSVDTNIRRQFVPYNLRLITPVKSLQSASEESQSSSDDEPSEKSTSVNRTEKSTPFSNKKVASSSIRSRNIKLKGNLPCCQQCGKAFTYLHNLKTHIKTVHNITKYYYNKCDPCKLKFDSIPEYKKHNLIHSKEYPMSCELCGRRFKQDHNLKVHQEKKHKISYEKDFTCNICNKLFATYANLRRHSQAHASLHQCNECGKSFKHNANLKQHITVVHKRDSQRKCPLCGKSFISSSLLEQHIKVTHAKEKKYQCDVCSRKYTFFSSLTAHKRASHKTSFTSHKTSFSKSIRTHQGKASGKKTAKRQPMTIIRTKDGGFQCPNCPKIFDRKDRLRQHSVIHSDPKFKCNNCQRPFYRKYYLREHMLKHHPSCADTLNSLNAIPTVKTLACDECDMMFYRNSDLVLHKIKHSNYRPFACQQCGKTFKTLHFLVCHTDGIHNREDKYKCDFCDRYFPLVVGRKRHEANIHFNERKLQCKLCSNSYFKQSDLDTHVTKRHKNKRGVFQCTLCTKWFLYVRLLNLHQKKEHSDQSKNFVCCYCDRKYTRKNNLKIHMKKMHG